MHPILFTTYPIESLERALVQSQPIEKGIVAIERYRNQELHCSLENEVHGRSCLILGAVHPPAEQLLATTLVAQTLKKEGAAEVGLLAPYLGYMRQDEVLPGASLGVQWLGQILKAAGVDRIVCLDLHSTHDRSLIGVPLGSIDPTPLFASKLQSTELTFVTVVAPDQGAEHRARSLATQLGGLPVATVIKTRDATGVKAHRLDGELTEQAIIVDDILDTGETLLAAARLLRDHGVKTLTIAVTHSLLTGESWQKLWPLGVDRILTTDSIRHKAVDDRIEVLPIAQLTPVIAAQCTAA